MTSNPGRNGRQVKWRLRLNRSRLWESQSRRMSGSSRATLTTPLWWQRLRISAGNIPHWWKGSTDHTLCHHFNISWSLIGISFKINILTGTTSVLVLTYLTVANLTILSNLGETFSNYRNIIGTGINYFWYIKIWFLSCLWAVKTDGDCLVTAWVRARRADGWSVSTWVAMFVRPDLCCGPRSSSSPTSTVTRWWVGSYSWPWLGEATLTIWWTEFFSLMFQIPGRQLSDRQQSQADSGEDRHQSGAQVITNLSHHSTSFLYSLNPDGFEMESR